MCMKNVNLTIITADILGNRDTKSVSLGNIDKPYYYEIVNGKRMVVGTFSFALFMQAIQTKANDSLSNINPDEKLLFSEKYSIKIRLTESKSGNAIDLDEFILCPNDIAFSECVCCDTFKYTRVCVYNNVILPLKKDNEFFVVKILIKHLTDDAEKDNQKPWTVQTVYPVSITEKADA